MIRIAIAAALAVMTMFHVETWRSPAALWGDAARRSPEKARPHLAEAMALMNEGRSAEAAYRAADGAQRWPDQQSEFLSIQGQSLLNLGQYADAAEIFKWAAYASPDNPRLWMNLGSARYRAFLTGQGALEPALEAYRKSLHLEIGAAALDGLADLMFYSGEWKSAVKSGIDARDPAGVYCLGKWMLLAGDYQAAAQWMTRASELKPEWTLAAYNTGLAFYSTGRDEDIQRAVEWFSRTLALDPMLNEARFNLGLALSRARKYESSARELQRSGLLDPRNPVHLKLWRMVQDVRWGGLHDS